MSLRNHSRRNDDLESLCSVLRGVDYIQDEVRERGNGVVFLPVADNQELSLSDYHQGRILGRSQLLRAFYTFQIRKTRVSRLTKVSCDP